MSIIKTKDFNKKLIEEQSLSDLETEYQQSTNNCVCNKKQLNIFQHNIQSPQISHQQKFDQAKQLPQLKTNFASLAVLYSQQVLDNISFKCFINSYRNFLAKKLLNKKPIQNFHYQRQRQSIKHPQNNNKKNRLFNEKMRRVYGAKCECGKIYQTFLHFKKHIQIKHQNKTPKGCIINFKQRQQVQYEALGKYQRENNFSSIKVNRALKQFVSSMFLKPIYVFFIKENHKNERKLKQQNQKMFQISQNKLQKILFKLHKDYFQIYKCNIERQIKFMTLIEHVCFFYLNFQQFAQSTQFIINSQQVLFVLFKWIKWINKNYQTALEKYQEDTSTLIFTSFNYEQIQNTNELYLVPHFLKSYLKQEIHKLKYNHQVKMENIVLENFYQYLKFYKCLV